MQIMQDSDFVLEAVFIQIKTLHKLEEIRNTKNFSKDVNYIFDNELGNHEFVWELLAELRQHFSKDEILEKGKSYLTIDEYDKFMEWMKNL